MNKPTYRVMQVVQPGTLELAEREIPSPGADEVLIAVEACGVCGADAADIEGADPSLVPPRVPGHEVVGRIAALGDGVSSRWQIGQRVGVGRLGGHCNECDPCRHGLFQLCRNQPFVGDTCDGGYAEMMLARATGLVAIPDELESVDAAPILCAGLATFNALKKCGAQAGDTVAIAGIGGLGHMAIQYARRMGFRVVAIGRGEGIEEDAMELGAHFYIDAANEDAAARLRSIGGAQAMVTTIRDAATVSAMSGGLAIRGRMVLLAAGREPLALPAGRLVIGERSVIGSITGSPYENERTLDFSVLAGVRPRIEVLPLERANEAYQRLKSGGVRYRMVLRVGEASVA